jgi:hypothetical protein
MLRFYMSDGWTKEELDGYCERGEVKCAHPDDADPYYTLASGSSFDLNRLIVAASGVHRAFDDYPHETDLQFLTRMNG